MSGRKLKIILNNGFKYEGAEQETEQGFVQILDSYDGKVRKFPNTSVSVIEILTADGVK